MAISLQGVVRSTSCLVLQWGFRGRRIEWAISGFARSKMAARPPSWKIQMAISPWWIIRCTLCLVLGWGLRGRQIEWHYFRFRQIQDGGSAAILENSNDDISARIIRFTPVFGSRMVLLGSADRMALFPVLPNSIGMWQKTMHEE